MEFYFFDICIIQEQIPKHLKYSACMRVCISVSLKLGGAKPAAEAYYM